MIEVKVLRDTTTRTVDMRLDEVTGTSKVTDEIKRVVILRLTGDPELIETGSSRRVIRFRPDALIITFKGGEMDGYRVGGPCVRRDGTGGTPEWEAFRPSGERRYLARTFPTPAPAEIMAIVKRFA